MTYRFHLVVLALLSYAGFLHGFQPTLRPITARRALQPPPSLPRGSQFVPIQSTLFASESEEGEKSRSINDLLSELGLSFKSRAEDNFKKSTDATTRTKKIGLALVSVGYFLLFLLYRAYRGFFVLLPAVFRQVYSKLETTVESDLSLEDEQEKSMKKATWKTKVTVSILAAVVTCSYFIGGAFRVIGKFVGTIGKTSSLLGAFGAAATEAVDHENRLKRRMSITEETGKAGGGASSPSDGLSP